MYKLDYHKKYKNTIFYAAGARSGRMVGAKDLGMTESRLRKKNRALNWILVRGTTLLYCFLLEPSRS